MRAFQKSNSNYFRSNVKNLQVLLVVIASHHFKEVEY